MPNQIRVLQSLSENMVLLIGEIKSLKDSLQLKQEVKPQEVSNGAQVNIAQIDPAILSVPVPQEYQELVNTILNKNFRVRMEYRTDAPLFEFAVIVPDKYSNMPLPQREIQKEDFRPKVISMAEGKNGVKEWCERVYKNFNTEIQSMIVADRLNA